MRIVITGGSGYLAGRIIEKLLSCRDYEITSISQGKSQFYLDNKIKYFSWDQKEDIHNAISNANIVLHTAGFNALDATKHPDKAKDFSHKSTKSIINSLNPESSTKLIFFQPPMFIKVISLVKSMKILLQPIITHTPYQI